MGDAGHTGDCFAFLEITCNAVLVFDDGVMDGTQKDGRLVLDA